MVRLMPCIGLAVLSSEGIFAGATFDSIGDF